MLRKLDRIAIVLISAAVGLQLSRPYALPEVTARWTRRRRLHAA